MKQNVIIADTEGLVLGDRKYQGRVIDEAKQACAGKASTSSMLDGQKLLWFPFIYEDRVMGAFGLAEGPEGATPDMISLLQGLAEVIVHQHILIDKLQPTIVVRGNFIKNLLEDTTMAPENAYRQADILQLNLHLPLIAILVQIENFEQRLHAEIGHLKAEEQALMLASHIETLTGRVRDQLKIPSHIFTYIGNNTFALLLPIANETASPASILNQLTKQTGELFERFRSIEPDNNTTLGVGQYYPDLGGLRKSYQEARLALDVGTKVWGTGKVYPIRKVGMFVSLANINQERKAELAHQLLHSLLNDPQLYKTVRTFLEAGLNLSTAADKLHIHRNTLIYRLNKTKKLIHLDPRHFEDALQIKLGLMFYQ